MALWATPVIPFQCGEMGPGPSYQPAENRLGGGGCGAVEPVHDGGVEVRYCRPLGPLQDGQETSAEVGLVGVAGIQLHHVILLMVIALAEQGQFDQGGPRAVHPLLGAVAPNRLG